MAMHFHNTNGMALENLLTGMEMGVTGIDSSVCGLGGCPFGGEKAKGNVATEDVVLLCQALGIQTGVDLQLLREAASFVTTEFRIQNKAFF